MSDDRSRPSASHAVGATLNATLADRRLLTDELGTFRVRLDEGVVPSFEPGQFVDVGLPPEPGDRRRRMRRRPYSIASSAADRDALELFVVRLPDGLFTRRLFAMAPGDRLWMSRRPRGHFTLSPVHPAQTLVMVATGTGLAPFMSMLRTYRGTGRWRRCIVINGARRIAELGYYDEILRLTREDPTITYVPVVSREPPERPWWGLRGHVQAALTDDVLEARTGRPLDPADCHVLLCGNPAMIDEAQQRLTGKGFVSGGPDGPGNVRFERFW